MQHRPKLKQNVSERAAAEPFGKRKVYWRTTGWVNCPLYERTKLASGQVVTGPAIIEEYGSTVVVPGSWTVRPDSYDNLILEKTT